MSTTDMPETAGVAGSPRRQRSQVSASRSVSEFRSATFGVGTIVSVDVRRRADAQVDGRCGDDDGWRFWWRRKTGPVESSMRLFPAPSAPSPGFTVAVPPPLPRAMSVQAATEGPPAWGRMAGRTTGTGRYRRYERCGRVVSLEIALPPTNQNPARRQRMEESSGSPPLPLFRAT